MDQDTKVNKHNGPADNERLRQLEEQVSDLTDKWKRALADYQNLDRRTHLEKESIVQYANSVLWLKILPIFDSLALALKAHPEQAGLAAIVRQFNGVLSREGVQEIDAAGQPFDPRFHDCLDVVEGEEDGKIVEVLRKGYKIGEKVLRPAQVRVSKNSPPDGRDKTSPAGDNS